MLKIGNLEFSSGQCLRVGVCVGALQYIKMLAFVALWDRGSRVKKLDFLVFRWLSSFQNGLICLATRNGGRDMTRRSWVIRALFRLFV